MSARAGPASSRGNYRAGARPAGHPERRRAAARDHSRAPGRAARAEDSRGHEEAGRTRSQRQGDARMTVTNPAGHAERFPMLTEAGWRRLRWLEEHPQAPRFNHQGVDRLTPGGAAAGAALAPASA